MNKPLAPQLEGDVREAVLHHGSHLQIIASAGSGKTEVVAQRFAQLMADGADPAGNIAFTFTERAADELKARISARLAAVPRGRAHGSRAQRVPAGAVRLPDQAERSRSGCIRCAVP